MNDEYVLCDELPIFRYTWPGQNEQYACLEHAVKLAAIADAMGFHLQMIPLDSRFDDNDRKCDQKVRVKNE